MSMTPARSWISAFVMSTCFIGPLLAQPESPPPPRERGDNRLPDDERRMNAPRIRRLINMRMERLQREQSIMREAIEMLDRGEPPERVRAHLRGVTGDGPENIGEFPDEPDMHGPPPRPRRPRGDDPLGDDPFSDDPQRQAAPPPPGAAGKHGAPGPSGIPGPPGGAPMGGPPPVERLMDVLSETNPRMYERLSRLRRDQPREFQRLLEEYAPRLARLAEERERFPERWPDHVRMIKLQPRIIEAARSIASLPEDQQAEAMDRLRGLLNEQFDLRLKFAKDDLERNERQRERIQREIEQSTRDRDQMIDRRMRELIDRERDRD